MGITELETIAGLAMDAATAAEQIIANPSNIFAAVTTLLSLASEFKGFNFNGAELQSEVLNLTDAEQAQFAAFLSTKMALPDHPALWAKIQNGIDLLTKGTVLFEEIVTFVKGL